MKEMKIFALNATKAFGEQVAANLKMKLSEHEEYSFEDGECYCASLENVRGKDVFVVQSVYDDNEESVHSKLMKTFIFLGALRDASVKRVTVVLPYIGGRQDRKTASRAPITTKYIARLFKAMWVDRILALDVHNPTAIQNAYAIPTDLLEAKNLFATKVAEMMRAREEREVVIVSPDSGGLERTDRFRRSLGGLMRADQGIACMYKTHRGKEIRGHGIMGDVKNKLVVIYDDLISSGKTVLECCEVCRKEGAREALAVCASHGLFVGNANEYLDNAFIRNIIITDTVKPFRITNQSIRDKLNIINTTHLFAAAIQRIHGDESISDLIQNHLTK